MKDDPRQTEAGQPVRQERPRYLSRSDFAPLVLLVVFMALLLDSMPGLWPWLLGLVFCALLIRLAYTYFRRRG